VLVIGGLAMAVAIVLMIVFSMVVPMLVIGGAVVLIARHTRRPALPRMHPMGMAPMPFRPAPPRPP
jgi:hypothetical protein